MYNQHRPRSFHSLCPSFDLALSEHVLSVGPVEVSSLLLQTGEVEEVRWAVHLVVELLGVAEGELVLHRGLVPDAHEVVVPRPLRRHHEEAEESEAWMDRDNDGMKHTEQPGQIRNQTNIS